MDTHERVKLYLNFSKNGSSRLRTEINESKLWRDQEWRQAMAVTEKLREKFGKIPYSNFIENEHHIRPAVHPDERNKLCIIVSLSKKPISGVKWPKERGGFEIKYEITKHSEDRFFEPEYE